MNRRTWLRGLLAAFGLLGLAVTGSAATHEKRNLIFAISEGTSGAQDTAEILAKYLDLGKTLEKALGRPVTVQLSRDFGRLEDDLKTKRIDLLLARPSDYPARAVRDYGYRLLAFGQGIGHAVFIVKGDSPLKDVKELTSREILMPEPAAYMTKLGRATLKSIGLDPEKLKIRTVRNQEVVAYGVETGIGDVGLVASYSGVMKTWEKKGGRVLFRGPNKPFVPIVASPNFNEADIAKLRQALLELSQSDTGKSILKPTGLPGFVAGEERDLIDLLKFLGA